MRRSFDCKSTFLPIFQLRRVGVTVVLALAAATVGLVTIGVSVGVGLTDKDEPKVTITGLNIGTQPSVGVYKHGGVASDHKECSTIGRYYVSFQQ